jgi:hypothetical protein
VNRGGTLIHSIFKPYNRGKAAFFAETFLIGGVLVIANATFCLSRVSEPSELRRGAIRAKVGPRQGGNDALHEVFAEFTSIYLIRPFFLKGN